MRASNAHRSFQPYSPGKGELPQPAMDWRGCTPNATSLEFPNSISVEDWHAVGGTLRRADSAARWWLGDWWRFGERYGKRVEVVRADDWEGLTMESCRNAASICNAFDVSRRRDTLRFSHHAEVASLPPEEADALLDWAATTIATMGKPRSTRELRAEVARRRTSAQAVQVVAHVMSVPAEPIRAVLRIVPKPEPEPNAVDTFGVRREPQPTAPQPSTVSGEDPQSSPLMNCLDFLATCDGALLGAAVNQERRVVHLPTAKAAREQLNAFIAELEGRRGDL